MLRGARLWYKRPVRSKCPETMTSALIHTAVGLLGGALGALVGLGGGVLLVPVLTLFAGVPIHQAIAASLVAVVATSTAAAVGYVRDERSNMRLGMTLETSTTVGAVAGGLAAALLDREALCALFGAALLLSAAHLLLRPAPRRREPDPGEALGLLGGGYYDPAMGRVVRYRVRRLPLGLAVSFAAGGLSGLLGIGGGPVQVPAMALLMGVPMKAAAATSNFMMGVTACASAALYYARGMVNPGVTVPLVLGTAAGAWAASRLGRRIPGERLSALLAVILALLALQMLRTAFGGA